MSRIKRWKDKLRGWKKIFLQNWALFRASKIGLIGLAIMIFFIIMALSAPFMDLRDPLWWRAPDSDIVEVTKYWPYLENNSDQFGNKPINHTIAARVAAAAGEIRTDRIYVPAGSRLYGIEPTFGLLDWLSPIDFSNPSYGDPNPIISADPIVVNWGDAVLSNEAYFWIYVTTYSGSVYAINDSVLPRSPPPSPVKIGTIDGYATGLAVYSGDTFGVTYNPEVYTPYDTVVVGSSTGFVYLWQVNNTGHHGPFIVKIGDSPIHIAGNPMRGYTSYPYFSPTFYYSPTVKKRPYLYVGSEDGFLTAIDIQDITNPRKEWQVQLLEEPSMHKWTSAPIVHYVPNEPINNAVVFAGTDESKLYALYAENGSYLVQWGGAWGIGPTALIVDTGVFTQPLLPQGSTTLFIGSSSGYVYSVSYIALVKGELPVRVNWHFVDDISCPDRSTYLGGAPFLFQSLLFIPSNCDLGPPGISPEDIGTVYALSQTDGKQSWSVSFDSPIISSVNAIEGPIQPQPHVFVGTMGGSEYSYSTTGLFLIPAPPSWIHPYPSGNTYLMGLDNRGRDIFSQWVWGSRIALFIGFSAAFIAISIGTIIGLVAGYFGGKIEVVLMRFTDVMLVIPSLPLIITLAAVLGSGVGNLILVIAIVGWTGVARVIRSQVLSLKERPFIESARVTGASHARIMVKHILPNVLPLAFLYMTFAVSGAILYEAALSFIGLGDISTVSWGRMLQDVSQSKALEAWYWLLPPGLAITLISLGFFLVGRAFDEIVNPRLRKR